MAGHEDWVRCLDSVPDPRGGVVVASGGQDTYVRLWRLARLGQGDTEESKVPTMVGFWEKSRKSDQMPYFGQKLVGFLGLQRNLEEFSRNSGIYLHDNV